MNRRLNTFLIWLLICLVPLQGVAASVRAFCGPDHVFEMSSTDTVTHGVDHGTAHRGAMMHAHGGLADASHAPTGHDHAQQHKSAFCGSCGSCCIGAFAPPSKINWELSATTVSIDIVSPAPLVTGYIPNGIERPPRYAPA